MNTRQLPSCRTLHRTEVIFYCPSVFLSCNKKFLLQLWHCPYSVLHRHRRYMHGNKIFRLEWMGLLGNAVRTYFKTLYALWNIRDPVPTRSQMWYRIISGLSRIVQCLALCAQTQTFSVASCKFFEFWRKRWPSFSCWRNKPALCSHICTCSTFPWSLHI